MFGLKYVQQYIKQGERNGAIEKQRIYILPELGLYKSEGNPDKTPLEKKSIKQIKTKISTGRTEKFKKSFEIKQRAQSQNSTAVMILNVNGQKDPI